MKKGDMATEAERLLADTGWLPEPLRVVEQKTASDDETTVSAGAGVDSAADDGETAMVEIELTGQHKPDATEAYGTAAE